MAAGEAYYYHVMECLHTVWGVALDCSSARTNGDDAAEKLKGKSKEKEQARQSRADKLNEE
eukprot:4289058-Prymnesium_polylepis.1